MTTVYFVRHAEADNTNRDGRNRPLTEKGWKDRELVTEYLKDKKIDIIISSPFKRAVDTVAHFAESRHLTVHTVEGFRERKSDSDWQRDTDYYPLMKRQWQDFQYTLSDGENLDQVQRRNVDALQKVISEHNGKNIVIGTHGMALSTIIHYYDDTYGFDDYMDMLYKLPWIAKFIFDGDRCLDIHKIDVA